MKVVTGTDVVITLTTAQAEELKTLVGRMGPDDVHAYLDVPTEYNDTYLSLTLALNYAGIEDADEKVVERPWINAYKGQPDSNRYVEGKSGDEHLGNRCWWSGKHGQWTKYPVPWSVVVPVTHWRENE